MNKAYRFYLAVSNKVLAGLLTLLGFSMTACDKEVVCEYGAPHADYEIKGKVVDDKGSIIPGIQIVISDNKEENEFMPPDTLVSDISGKFDSHPAAFTFGEDITFKITAKDTDGEANGGLFEDTATEVNFKKEDLKGASGNWYYGKAEKEVTIVMKNKK